eukprot:265399-Pyramimonas_sp.AAC.1
MEVRSSTKDMPRGSHSCNSPWPGSLGQEKPSPRCSPVARRPRLWSIVSSSLWTRLKNMFKSASTSGTRGPEPMRGAITPPAQRCVVQPVLCDIPLQRVLQGAIPR